ncbi:hypothetical protein K435DRAFT_125190 [Dendrothele bispora CBS 962.96]|uniref:Uncharacterized protein n=1 Tax=Dendrothele bispora (strain CBS 962.96) TaxID=1314807 RepID=A0A4S8M0L4_DENBC|nr:hypothetical protein K435DRAFT_125190 [Dendrothele bispora CBS 962.96]
MIIIPWLFHHCFLIYHCPSFTYILHSFVDSSLVCPLCPSCPYCSALPQYYVDVGPLWLSHYLFHCLCLAFCSCVVA